MEAAPAGSTQQSVVIKPELQSESVESGQVQALRLTEGVCNTDTDMRQEVSKDMAKDDSCEGLCAPLHHKAKAHLNREPNL